MSHSDLQNTVYGKEMLSPKDNDAFHTSTAFSLEKGPAHPLIVLCYHQIGKVRIAMIISVKETKVPRGEDPGCLVEGQG